MKNYLAGLDEKTLGIVRRLGRELDKRGVPAYIVGGVVRDILLKRKNLDIDIVVEADAPKLARVLAGIFKARVRLYDQFGTAALELPSGGCVDLATARKERYVDSGALPVVERGTLRDDLLRRDFTVNAMAVSINRERWGDLVDDFGGLEDLRRKVIRVLHRKSFEDDPTRILRAVRFEQRFGFSMEPETRVLLERALAQGRVDNVKPPRYFAEFKKTLSEEDPLRCLRRLAGLGGLRFLDPDGKPDLHPATEIHRGLRRMKRKAVFSRQQSHWLLYFMALVEPLGARRIEDILNKFHFKRDEKDSIRMVSDVSSLLKQLSEKDYSRSRVYHLLRPLPWSGVLYLRLRAWGARSRRCIDRYLDEDAEVGLEITGEDVKRLGVDAGARVGAVLGYVLGERLDRKVAGRRAQLNAAKKFIHQQGE